MNSHLQGHIVGEVLYHAFCKVKLDEREVNSHLQAYIVGEVLYLALVKLNWKSGSKFAPTSY